MFSDKNKYNNIEIIIRRRSIVLKGKKAITVIVNIIIILIMIYVFFKMFKFDFRI